ncbi:epsin-like isoform X2 [Schistocerca gregaria]|nr:epsin-like isoform X2 [Schistocerca gregaria]
MTNNEQWGPTGTDLRRIAYLTYSPSAYDEIMSVLWERIEDYGKNWRHIYKALLVLDFLLKNGCDRVISQVQCNQVIIKTLEYFSFIEDDEDVGFSIRQRASRIIELLQDPKKLAEERELAARNREKFSQQMYTNKNQAPDGQIMIQNYPQENRYVYPGLAEPSGQKFPDEGYLNVRGNPYDNVSSVLKNSERYGSQKVKNSLGKVGSQDSISAKDDDVVADLQKVSKETKETAQIQDMFDELLKVNNTPAQTTSENFQQMNSGFGANAAVNPVFEGMSQNVNMNKAYGNYNFNTGHTNLQSSNPFSQPSASSTQNQLYQPSLQRVQMNNSYQLDSSGYSEFQSSASTANNAIFFNQSSSSLAENVGQSFFQGALPDQRNPGSASAVPPVVPSTENFDPWKTSSIDLSFLDVKNRSIKPNPSNIAQE